MQRIGLKVLPLVQRNGEIALLQTRLDCRIAARRGKRASLLARGWRSLDDHFQAPNLSS